ncbi:hypothetical protein KPL71_021247 [Citrus sinensis]|uniref:Uncharacterized protein n=1 Tax=Citrus sinensis TaxID=2711 RepID=A0ACB8JDV8_CITSI|nr:hypothetical protein KPL71_021247 [Citrus sinensis]
MPDFVESSSDSEEQVMDRAAPVERTLRELAEPDFNQQSLCIQYVDLEVNFELKSGLIHLLPKFHGFAGEDPHKHLKEFHVVCLSMRPQGVTEEQIKLRAFPFSLDGLAKDWLYYLPLGSITTWNGLKKQFLEKYFPASRAANIRKDICGIRQLPRETLYEYWERFKQFMIDAASGGVLVNKTHTQVRELISNMAANAQQFGSRQDPTSRKVNEVKTCGICYNMGHSIDMCPTLQEELVEQANVVGGFPGMPQRRYDPYAQTYNPGWKDHPNFNYGVRPSGFPQQYSPRQSIPPQSNFKSESQVLTRLPSQSEVNPKQNVSVVILRSGKELQEPSKKVTKHVKDELEKNELMPKSQDAQPTRVKPYLYVRVEKAMLDLGTSINIMPRSIYSSLNVGPLKETGVIIQLVDRSNAYLDGVLEDVLVQVNELVFPTDFYVLDMEEDNSSNSVPILLEIPFLKTARTKMDVHKGTLTMEFDEEVIEFNMNVAMKYPIEIRSSNSDKIFKVNGHRLKPFYEARVSSKQQPEPASPTRKHTSSLARATSPLSTIRAQPEPAAVYPQAPAEQQSSATSPRPVFQPRESKFVSEIIVTMPKREASTSKSSKKTPVAKQSKIDAPTTVPWNTVSDSLQAVRQRSKHGKGTSVLPLAESNLEGCLTFTTPQEKKMYKYISKRKILPAKYIHYPTLEKLNVKDNFDSLIDKIGLRKFVDVDVDCLGYVELIREFYATFQFNIPNDFTLHTPDVIKFSYAYLGTTCDFSENFEPYGLWRNLSFDHNAYDPSKSKSSFLRDPILKYQFQSVLKRYRTLFLGPYITLLAINLCVFDPDNNDLHSACKKEFLDMSVFERIGVVEFKEGRFQFTEPGPTHPPKKLYARSGATSDDEFDDETAAPPTIPSTSAPLFPPSP